jgi:peroxiredoxin
MNISHDPTQLPEDLPVPEDDGACDHLRDAAIPAVALSVTSGDLLDLRILTREPTVLFFYPRTGVPGQPPVLGFGGEEWDSIPGARGCTPQSCGFRDLHSEFAALGVRVFGVSTNSTARQLEFKTRSQVPFEFLSDADLVLTRVLKLPTFEFPVESGGPTTLLRRMAWYCEGSRVVKLWYPVFPANQNAGVVLGWLRDRGH